MYNLAQSTIHSGWVEFFQTQKFILDKIDFEIGDNIIFPAKENIFRAFSFQAPRNVKVVLLGMDPYPTGTNPNDCVAQGLAFSVDKKPIPASLRNIYKEIANEGITCASFSGDLSDWAKQGILLLNSALTILPNKTGSHLKIWHPFTRAVIQYLAEQSNVKKLPLFVLWGKDAQKVAHGLLGDAPFLKSTHPSPLSSKGFFGNGHFKAILERYPDIVF
jgi:uracil-DNA glycosylase